MVWRAANYSMSDYPPVAKVDGELLTFDVRSDTDGWPYRVDLAAFNGNGVCQCKDFQIRKFGKLLRGEIENGEELVCKHIRRAQMFFAREVVQRMLKPGQPQAESTH